MSRRIKNPSPIATLALLALAGGGVYYATTEYKKRKKKDKKKEALSALNGVWAENATLQPIVADYINLPMTNLFTKPHLRNSSTGEITEAPNADIVDQETLRSVVTNLTTDAQNNAFEIMTFLVADKGYNLNLTDQLDKAVREVLVTIAPKFDWSKGLAPYTYGSPPVDVWAGVQLLGELAHQTHYNNVIDEANATP